LVISGLPASNHIQTASAQYPESVIVQSKSEVVFRTLTTSVHYLTGMFKQKWAGPGQIGRTGLLCVWAFFFFAAWVSVILAG
jgi:hypothetical protein